MGDGVRDGRTQLLDDGGRLGPDVNATERGLGEASALSRGPRQRGGCGLAWFLVVVCLGAGAAAGYLAYEQLNAERAEHAATRAQLQAAGSALDELREQSRSLQTARDEASAEAKRAAEALASMEQTQAELQKRLQEEVSKGDVLISQQNGELVVDLLDKIVFDSGKADLTEQGKAVLRQVGETLAKVPDKVLHVSGHTDNMRISKKLVDQFPTNWELSTARATNVVRFLQDEVKVPGLRLAASGYAEYRPIARNNKSSGRKRNRRIEIRLMPLPNAPLK